MAKNSEVEVFMKVLLLKTINCLVEGSYFSF